MLIVEIVIMVAVVLNTLTQINGYDFKRNTWR